MKFLLILIISIGNFTVSGQNTWRFAVIGDTHIGATDTIAEMIPFILADSIDFVLMAGDIAEGGLGATGAELQTQLTEWRTIFAPVYAEGISVYPVRGNHEADAHNNTGAWNAVFTGSYLLPQNGPMGEENLTYSFNHKNAFIIGLDNYTNIHKVNQNWLSQQLALNTSRHIFVFGHEAAFKVFHSDCLDDSLTARNTFWQSLSQAGVKAYFCGHDHFVDVARIDDGDENIDNDVYQYLVGTGGGWLMSQYSNYNGTNTHYTPIRIFHEMEYGFALVEISGDSENDCYVTIKWKQRTWNSSTSSYEYIANPDIIQYSACNTSIINAIQLVDISVFPNPADNYLTVSGLTGLTKIYNNMAKEMWTGNNEDAKSIDISAFPNGLYYIRNSNSSTKFIIAR